MADTTCAVQDCLEQPHCRGWCGTHYQRWRRHGDPTHLVGDGTLKKCLDCDTLIAKTRNGGRLRCEPCRKEIVRKANAKSYARLRELNPVPLAFICVGCGGEFPRPFARGARKRCADCRVVDQRRVSREGNAKTAALRQDRFEKDGRSSPCAACGATIVHARVGMPASVCSGCRRLGLRPRKAVDSSRYGNFHCQDCGVTFPNLSYNRVSIRCLPCQKQEANRRRKQWKKQNPDLVREAGRRSSHVRRARIRGGSTERIDLREIYERDNWTCGICRKRINRRLKYPHPMSASIDHLIPLSQGGGHVRANLRAAHRVCNVNRGIRGGNEQLMLIG